MTNTKRQEEIVIAASKIFARQGYHNTSINDIIKEAGIARGTFYLYFKNKRSIFEYILDSIIVDSEKLIKRLNFQNTHLTPLQQLKENAERILTYFVDKPDVTRILLHYGYGNDPEIDVMLDDFYRKIRIIIESALELGQEWGIITNTDIKVLSFGLLGIVKEVLIYIGENKEVDIQYIVEVLLRSIIFGIASNKIIGGKSIWEVSLED